MTSAAIIRDKEFAKRIEIACENHPHAPSGHGRQKWLRDKIWEKFAHKLSAEALRKWFAGESRPRPKIMTMVAKVLEVDEAWLSLGIKPDQSPREKHKQNATAAGAVNLVAAHIQLAGGNIAFPEDEADEEDIFAIVRGKRHSVTVRTGTVHARFKITIPGSALTNTIIVVVPTDSPTVYQFVRVPGELIKKYGKQQGGYVEIEIDQAKGLFTIDDDRLSLINSFMDLDGEVTTKAVASRSKKVG